MDITEQAQVHATISRVAPDYVIHTAAFTDVDTCEIEPQRAWDVNALGTKNVAEACEEHGAKLIYISTDYVFDGEDGPYSEEAPTHPINVYGESKLAGEGFALNSSVNAVARVCVLYGPDKPNFVTWVINSLRTHTPINVVSGSIQHADVRRQLCARPAAHVRAWAYGRLSRFWARATQSIRLRLCYRGRVCVE